MCGKQNSRYEQGTPDRQRNPKHLKIPPWVLTLSHSTYTQTHREPCKDGKYYSPALPQNPMFESLLNKLHAQQTLRSTIPMSRSTINKPCAQQTLCSINPNVQVNGTLVKHLFGFLRL